jgi:hypothetical protein
VAHHLREGTQLIEVAHTLEAAVDEARVLDVVRKKDIHDGDRVVVTTRNSRYTIWTVGNGLYWVWGGWFDLQGSSPQRMTINGCTWGGSVIERDIVAARGLRLEFGNTVLTTRIEEVHVIRARTHVNPN